MILSGKLCLDYASNDYLIVGNGRLTNLSETLNVMLLEDVKVVIKNTYDGKELFNVKGKLIKEKVDKGFYLYYVDGQDMDSVLWDFVDRKIEIDIKNITKE